MADSDPERRLRGLLSQKRMTNQLLRERRKSTEPASNRFRAPDPEDEDTDPTPTAHWDTTPETAPGD